MRLDWLPSISLSPGSDVPGTSLFRSDPVASLLCAEGDSTQRKAMVAERKRLMNFR